MKKTLVGLFVFVSGLSIASISQADTFSVGIELPLSYTFRAADDGANLKADGFPVGLAVFVQLPLFSGGLGVESYDIKIDQPGDHRIVTNMIDAFYRLPLPVVNLSLGLGIGQAEVKGDNAAYYEPTTSTQYFLRLGIPVNTWAELTASYHRVDSRIKVKDRAYRLEAGGTMGAIGMNIGF
jgi:hypothetical protein